MLYKDFLKHIAMYCLQGYGQRTLTTWEWLEVRRMGKEWRCSRGPVGEGAKCHVIDGAFWDAIMLPLSDAALMADIANQSQKPGCDFGILIESLGSHDQLIVIDLSAEVCLSSPREDWTLVPPRSHSHIPAPAGSLIRPFLSLPHCAVGRQAIAFPRVRPAFAGSVSHPQA